MVILRFSKVGTVYKTFESFQVLTISSPIKIQLSICTVTYSNFGDITNQNEIVIPLPIKSSLLLQSDINHIYYLKD